MKKLFHASTIILALFATLSANAQLFRSHKQKSNLPPPQQPFAAAASDVAWTFAYSGDSRNCGDFVMPVIASKVRAEGDQFYWHLGDFRWFAPLEIDADIIAMQPDGKKPSREWYNEHAWDDFIEHQLKTFGDLPVFLSRGNHEAVSPNTREGYIQKFATYLNRPEIEAQRKADGPNAAPIGPWFHWIRDGVDFISLDNASHDEFSDAQIKWLTWVINQDLKPNSGIRTIVAGMHEALPHSTNSQHAMDDWERGTKTGEQVYEMFYQAQVAGKHVYILASHSHYYSPNIFASDFWKAKGEVVPGWIMGAAGAKRGKLPKEADSASKTHIYGYLQGIVHKDGTIDFKLNEFTEDDLMKLKWPTAPDAAVHECFVGN